MPKPNKEDCTAWRANPLVNPMSGRAIKPSGRVYKELEEDCRKWKAGKEKRKNTQPPERAKSQTGPVMSLETCNSWRLNPLVNPLSGRKITREGPTYKALEKQCQQYQSNTMSAQSSSTKQSAQSSAQSATSVKSAKSAKSAKQAKWQNLPPMVVYNIHKQAILAAVSARSISDFYEALDQVNQVHGAGAMKLIYDMMTPHEAKRFDGFMVFYRARYNTWFSVGPEDLIKNSPSHYKKPPVQLIKAYKWFEEKYGHGAFGASASELFTPKEIAWMNRWTAHWLLWYLENALEDLLYYYYRYLMRPEVKTLTLRSNSSRTVEFRGYTVKVEAVGPPQPAFTKAVRDFVEYIPEYFEEINDNFPGEIQVTESDTNAVQSLQVRVRNDREFYNRKGSVLRCLCELGVIRGEDVFGAVLSLDPPARQSDVKEAQEAYNKHADDARWLMKLVDDTGGIRQWRTNAPPSPLHIARNDTPPPQRDLAEYIDEIITTRSANMALYTLQQLDKQYGRDGLRMMLDRLTAKQAKDMVYAASYCIKSFCVLYIDSLVKTMGKYFNSSSNNPAVSLHREGEVFIKLEYSREYVTLEVRLSPRAGVLPQRAQSFHKGLHGFLNQTKTNLKYDGVTKATKETAKRLITGAVLECTVDLVGRVFGELGGVGVINIDDIFGATLTVLAANRKTTKNLIGLPDEKEKVQVFLTLLDALKQAHPNVEFPAVWGAS